MVKIEKECLMQWFSTREQFCPLGTSGNVWRHFWSSQQVELVVGVPMASSGWGLVMLQDSFRCMREVPTTRTYLAPNVHSDEIETPWFNGTPFTYLENSLMWPISVPIDAAEGGVAAS